MPDDLITDTNPFDPDEEAAATYPIRDDQHIGVDTDSGTNPDTTDQDDEEIRREQTGIPD